MRTVIGLVTVFVVLLGIAGAAMAECSADHPDTARPTTTKPLPQS